MVRRIFIGDIHAAIKPLRELISQLNINATDEVVFLGDYIDRGPRNRETLGYLKQFKETYPNTRFLWGNHDLLLWEYVKGGHDTYLQLTESIQTLKDLTGIKKLVNYTDELIDGETGQVVNNKVRAIIKGHYSDFFDLLEPHVEYEEQVAVHGYLDLSLQLPVKNTTLNQKVWLRNSPYGNRTGKVIIVGHTPNETIQVNKGKRVINVDTGAVFGGELSAVIYDTHTKEYRDQKGNLLLI